MDEAIEAEGLGRRFGSVNALDGVTLSVGQGEVFGMLGPNGAGKTTAVRLLNGILAPSAGSARVLGMDPVANGCDIRRQVGVLTETPSLYERLSARENLVFFGTLYCVPEADLPRRVDELLDFFDLRDRAADKAGGYSKGMKQRLALARALIHEPQLLFLDEPTSGLDPEAAGQVMDLIEQLSHQRGRTVFLCTHNLDEAQRLCDRVAVMNHGRLLALGSLDELSQELWQGSWVDFDLLTPLSSEQTEALRSLPAVRGVTADGARLSVQVGAEDAIPGLVAAVAAGGGRIMRVNPREHSLEEIYFELQKREKTHASSPGVVTGQVATGRTEVAQ